MIGKKYIPVLALCEHHKVEISFFHKLNEIGLISIKKVDDSHCLHYNNLDRMDRIIRIHKELNVNIEGIDVIFNLLDKIELLENKLEQAKNRLVLFDNDDFV